ncbi:MAG TPA: dTDP-glucose 4,6-dehydratase [Lentisphaeria bacterium]|nr:MAG: dTDP-glucose 4,6-dehydratase [Lentisphaerae bacterium GWF2_38_69]HBM17174.1 dTDP-glucose 4,6-dehydratase [Lentisphaeria bacterium]
MKNILVTGGAGFIGVNFVRMLLNETDDINVINYDALTYAGNLASLDDCLNNERHIFIHGDICDINKVEDTFERYSPEGVINFAAESHVDRSITDPDIFLKTNIMGTLSLLRASRKFNVKRFLQVSTDEVYGSLGLTGKFTEATNILPNSPYSASKASADHFVRAFNHTYDFDTVITRCSNNYGPYQFPEKMIPLCINNILKNKNLPVYGDGMQIRDWLFVKDHCTAIWEVFNKGKSGEVYNIGGSNEKANLELVKILLKILNKPESLITFVKDRPGHDRRYAIDNSKIMSDLNWKLSVTFEQGIELTVKWYLDNKKWLENVTSGAYQNYYSNMYSNR